MTPTANASLPAKNFLRSPAWLTALLITVVIVGFHFYFILHAGGFWRDEVNLINVAHHHSLDRMIHDSFPLLMPLLVKGWSGLGLAQSDVNLRLLGLLIGIGIVAGLWLAAWQARRQPPLVSLVLFALNSTVITFGDSLRAYGLGSLMIVLMLAAAWFFLKQPGWKRAAWLSLFAVLSVQSLYHNAVLVGAICLGAMAVCVRRKKVAAAGQVLAAGFVAAVSLLPYVPNFIAGRKSIEVLRTGLSWPRFFYGLEEALGFPWAQFVFVWALLAVVAVVWAAVSLRKKSDGEGEQAISSTDARLFAGTAILTAVAGFLGFLWLTALPGQPWYFLPLMILAASCFDVFYATLPQAVRIGFLIGVLVVFAISLPVTKRDLNYRFTNIDNWATALSAEAKPDDYAVVTPWFCGITFAHYFKGAMPWTTLPPLMDHTSHRYDLVQKQMETTNAIQPVLKKISATLRAGHRVWFLCPADVVKMPTPGSRPPADLPPPPLPGSGWSDEPYEVMWTLQTIYFLAQHGGSFRRVNDDNKNLRTAENLGLFVIQGWNDNTNTPSDKR